jgi:hypothetical protein
MLFCPINYPTKMRRYFLLFSALIFLSFADVSPKKRISDEHYRYEFYTTNKVISPDEGREYFWFKGGLIHNSEYGVGGELLHNDFFKYYHSNQLAEAGKFKKGLKEGYWKTWFENGTLQSKVYWDNGQKDGTYYGYDQTGFLTETGKYKNNLKEGRWINYISKDTLKYRDGKVVVKKEKVKKTKDTLQQKENKPGFFKRLFGKKNKATKDGEVTTPSAKKTGAMAPAQNQEKKDGFFKRLFSKKDKSNSTKNNTKTAKVATPQNKDDGFFKRLFSKKDKQQKTNGTGS